MNEGLIIILHSYKLELATHHPPLVEVEVVSEDLIMIDCPSSEEDDSIVVTHP